MCDLFAMLQQRYEDFSSEILILSFCVYVSTLHIFLLCLFSYSGLILVLTSFLFYPYCYSRCGRLLSYSLSKGGCSLLVHIRPYSIFLFFITGYFYFMRVVRNDSLVRRLWSREVGHVPLDV